MKEPEMEHATLGGAHTPTWQQAALRVGEDLSTVGPDGYYAFTQLEWLDWARNRVAILTREHERLTAERDAHANQCASAERELLAAYAEVERLTAALQEAKRVEITDRDEDGDVVVQLRGYPNWHLAAHGSSLSEALLMLSEVTSEVGNLPPESERTEP